MPAAIVVLFDIGHSEEARHRLKTCQKCQVIYHYSHYTKPNETFVDGSRAKFVYEDSLDSDYFLASSSSGFSVRFLRTYFSEIFEQLKRVSGLNEDNLGKIISSKEACPYHKI